jgi:hypothetical protein
VGRRVLAGQPAELLVEALEAEVHSERARILEEEGADGLDPCRRVGRHEDDGVP